jgi:hypothetical protein
MDQSKNEKWPLEVELRQLIDIAIRYPIDGVYSSVTINRRYSSVLSNVLGLRQQFDLFSSQLTERLGQTNNWDAIEKYLNIQFLRGIDSYLKWYESNVEKTKKFEPYNPYEVLHNICESTKDKILSHFDNKPNSTIKNPFKNQQTAELFEYIVENWSYTSATKWGYIWNYFVQKGNGKMTYKSEYESYLMERGLMVKGKPNYDACNSDKRLNELEDLKSQFSITKDNSVNQKR